MNSGFEQIDKPDRNGAGRRTASPKRILLISNKVMHYRISVYNYFHERFRECGYEFSVIADSVEKVNPNSIRFDFYESPFSFSVYKKRIQDLQPDAVIIFLRLKDWIIWPLVHWLKFRRIPFAIWTKGGNWDAKESQLRYQVFNYIHGVSDAIILYSRDCLECVKPPFRGKTFVANNTLNFEDFPTIQESKDSIKRELGISFEKVVVFVGRMGAAKGRKRVDHLLEVFRSLVRKDVGLVLVGSGMSEDLKSRMNILNTKYLGEVHDERNVGISKILKMADICVIPGHVGLGLNQAFFWGLPVITEEDKHPPEIAYLKPGRNGFIVPRNDLSALRDRIEYLLDHGDVRSEFSRNARMDILEEASIEGMFSGFSKCVHYLTQGQMSSKNQDRRGSSCIASSGGESEEINS